MEVPIIGCHRSGTSVTAGVLMGLGVNMGDRWHPATEWNTEHWEDLDFWLLNHSIWDAAGVTPEQAARGATPTLAQIQMAGKWFRYEIKYLVEWKQHRAKWGWKDPLNTLTWNLYVPYLKDPRFVCTKRNVADITTSLLRGHEDEFWTEERCNERATELSDLTDRFLERAPFPCIKIQFEKLINKETARAEVERLARFVGVEDPLAIEAGLAQIKFRGELCQQ